MAMNHLSTMYTLNSKVKLCSEKWMHIEPTANTLYFEKVPSSLGVASFFTLIEFKSLSPSFGCSFVQWTWWEPQNWTFEVKVCSIFNLKIWSSFFDICCLFWCNGTARLVVGAWSQTRQQNVNNRKLKLKSPYATNFDFKCPILKFSSCSLDKTTSKTQW